MGLILFYVFAFKLFREIIDKIKFRVLQETYNKQKPTFLSLKVL